MTFSVRRLSIRAWIGDESRHDNEVGLAMLPTFIVIGAMKCGTTSLYYHLDAHPRIAMSDRKETDFFIRERNFERGQDWYEARFAGEGKSRGECSPNYTKAHLFSGVARRMHRLVPDGRLIYMVRDPIDRIISHYVGNRVQGREERSFAAAVTANEENNYYMTSRYFWQLKPYLEVFGADQILVRSLESLAEDPAEVLRDIHCFVGEKARVYERQLQQGRFNATSRKRRRGDWYHWLTGLLSQPMKDTLRPYMPQHWIPGTPVERPDLSETLRGQLTEALRSDVEALRRLTGRSFDRWSL